MFFESIVATNSSDLRRQFAFICAITIFIIIFVKYLILRKQYTKLALDIQNYIAINSLPSPLPVEEIKKNEFYSISSFISKDFTKDIIIQRTMGNTSEKECYDDKMIATDFNVVLKVLEDEVNDHIDLSDFVYDFNINETSFYLWGSGTSDHTNDIYFSFSVENINIDADMKQKLSMKLFE